MEQCLRDQQFVTLLLYLNDICIFAPDVDIMLNCVKMVFNRLKNFHLKTKPKKYFHFQLIIVFLGHFLSVDGISANPEKVDKENSWPIPQSAKELHSFLGLASYYRCFIPNSLLIWHNVHMLCLVQSAIKRKIQRIKIVQAN